MLRFSKKAWAQLGATGLIAGLLASAAIGAESSGSFGSSADALHSEAAAAVETVALPAAAGHAAGQAVAVLSAIAGGSNPSVVAAQRTESEPAAQAEKGGQAANHISAAQRIVIAGTGGARPGWGCGDPNHTHSGPPGRPGATPPPGCTK